MSRCTICERLEKAEKTLEKCKRFASPDIIAMMQTEVDILRGFLYANVAAA